MSKLVIVGLLLSLFLVSGCMGIGEDTMKIEQGDVVSLHYTGTLDDGTQFDSSEGREPLTFTASANPPQVIKGFDDAVLGMEVGEEKTFRIPPEEAYGTDPAAHPLGGKALNFKIKIVNIDR